MGATVAAMGRPRAGDVLVLGAAPVAAATLVAVDEATGALDLLWAAILFECLAVLCLLARASVRRETAARRAAERLSATGLHEAARRAVLEERALLAADIEAVVRSSTSRMAALADQAARRWDDDPSPALAGVLEEGRRATQELRRMLGLLRDAEDSADPGPPPGPVRAGGSWRARDVAIGGGAVLLALAETLTARGWAGLPEGSDSPSAWVLTALAAATLVLRGVAPGGGAAACGLVFVVGEVIGHPVTGGLWVLGTLGGLAWAAAVRGGRAEWLGVGVLGAGVAAAQAWRDPGNLGIDLVVLAVPALAGAFVGRRRARAARAADEARGRALELARAAEAAVRAERLAVARDLHDVVSHGVGVMVTQAGAARALHGMDPERARAALDVVRQTAAASAEELDRLMEVISQGAMGAAVDAAHGRVRAGSLPALARRMQAAGLRVELSEDGPLEEGVAGAVYRVVQESLTNALRHAPGALVRVRVATTASTVEITVEDDGPGPSGAARRGFGLVGIAERVTHLGGELTTGLAHEAGGFRVHARIPRVREQSARVGA